MEVCQNFTHRSCALKGKRKKRSRPSSPLYPAGMTTSVTTTTRSSTVDGSDDGGGGRGEFYNSPTASTTQISTTSTSEEDEDMANCLILLAQSGSCGQKVQVVTELKKEKINSRKFAEMATITTGKAGFYVYECKTCNRTFPSFQALGGHRASHKKPKTIVEVKKSVTVTTTATDTVAAHDDQQRHQETDHEQGRLNKISISHLNQAVVNNNNNSKTKIHECSICGSEFSSGQALGGHMRRHRPPTTTMTTTTNTKISTNFEMTISNVSESSSSHHDEKSTRNIFSLDLNLPAPPEDDHIFEQSIVFSAAPLVDCCYF